MYGYSSRQDRLSWGLGVGDWRYRHAVRYCGLVDRPNVSSLIDLRRYFDKPS